MLCVVNVNVELDCVNCYAVMSYQIMDFSLEMINGKITEMHTNVSGQAIVNGDTILSLDIEYANSNVRHKKIEAHFNEK